MSDRLALQNLQSSFERDPSPRGRIVDAHHRDFVLDGVDPAGIEILTGDWRNLAVWRARGNIGLDGSGRLQSGIGPDTVDLVAIFLDESRHDCLALRWAPVGELAVKDLDVGILLERLHRCRGAQFCRARACDAGQQYDVALAV